jgi:hypothetical protein
MSSVEANFSIKLNKEFLGETGGPVRELVKRFLKDERGVTSIELG